ncbi:putative Zn-dependent peptidase [Novosphingobium kunmingense]|uniref:Putative Zn-dependent peptidase n=1 Tax=Novosphingobium kunmingense TaxID=1211806 RepID=A0A2N0HKL7_9SPHN|nr:pitrilysin family protein [Novosphingobium kunmingense]PKB19497.1 putative Zn-dependent peptidase [Novosphingobium kunmingense]
MRQFAAVSLIALALSACTTALPDRVASAPPAAPAAVAEPAPAPLADLVRAVDIPYESFTLANGLKVIVHTDRKAPIVGVTTYYRVGSKHEPRGKTGFAHLYEHLFFGGSENVPNFDVPLEGAGSTSTNGSTWYDRTNYVETVPKGALDLALFMESDRMGHLLGAVTQDKLDKQRGVVQNEKRQGDNQPYGLEDYAIGDALFPIGHPYRHSTIGSMADLSAASLTDVRKWFTDNYGPNNAVLALTGDIDAATARPLVEKWFGDIKPGPLVPVVAAAPVTLSAPVTRDLADQVPNLRLTRSWSGPGINDADTEALMVGMDILGGLASSRLDNALVRGSEQAVQVSAMAQQHEQLSFLQVAMMVKDGVARADAERALDAVIAKFLADGPTEDEVRRSATRLVSQEIGQLEQVGDFGGKGMTLAEGQLYSGDPAAYKKQLEKIAALTPAEVKAAMNRWLSRPVAAINTVPGTRTEKGETMGGWGDEATTPAPAPDAKKPAPKLATGPKRTAPPVAPVGDLAFPAIERAKLANGIPVTLVRRTSIPKVAMSLNFDAGTAADALDRPGTQSLMLGLLDEGTATRDATQIAEAQERLGATISAGPGIDSSAVSMTALSANLSPSLALLADVVRNPAFRDADVARVRDQRISEIAQVESNPGGLAVRSLAPILFGAGHPYGLPGDGLGFKADVSAQTAQSLKAAHQRWIRPETLKITVVGDITMDALLPMLNASFGDWAAPAGIAMAVKDIARPAPAPQPRIVLIDRPNSPQSVIVAGRVLPLTGRDADKEALDLANEVLGNGFLSRLNLDLREDKGWSYGVRSSVSSPLGSRALTVVAPVQADRTGDSIKLILADMAAFPASKPVDKVELARVTDGNVRGLPNRFQTNAQVLGAVVTNERLGRPDNYISTLASRYRAIDAAAIDTMARTYLGKDGLTFVVVGDRKVVEPQLKSVGLPVEVASAVDSASKAGK